MGTIRNVVVVGLTALTLGTYASAVSAAQDGRSSPSVTNIESHHVSTGRSIWKGNSNSISLGNSTLIERMGDPTEIKQTPQLL